MTRLQLLVGLMGVTAGCLVVAGMLFRDRVRFARAFTALLAFQVVTNVLIVAWPSAFWNWGFWVFKQVGIDMLQLATAVEVAWWACLGFPGAAQATRRALFVVLILTFLAVMVIPEGINSGAPVTLLASLRPRFEVGISWLFTAIAFVIRYYDLPVHPMHLRIAVGMAVSLSIFGLFIHRLGSLGLGYATGEPWVTLVPAADVAICFWWVAGAWKPEPELSEAQAGVLRQLQPWRVR